MGLTTDATLSFIKYYADLLWAFGKLQIARYLELRGAALRMILPRDPRPPPPIPGLLETGVAPNPEGLVKVTFLHYACFLRNEHCLSPLSRGQILHPVRLDNPNGMLRWLKKHYFMVGIHLGFK